MSYYSDNPSNIMNVREIIDSAFGDFEGNAVNFKLVQTVLYLLARHMRLLERRVEVELAPLAAIPSGSTLSVTEVKIHAMQKKKKKTKDETDKGAGGGKSGGGKGQKKSGRTPVAQSTSDKTSTGKTSSDKTSTEKTSSDIISSDKTSSDKTSTDKTSSSKTTSSKDKSSSKSPSDKLGERQAPLDQKAGTDKASSKGQGSDKTKEPAADKTSSKRAGGEKSSSKQAPSGTQRKLDSYSDILETMEERKEKILRIIHQRADSFEEAKKSPTPMASVDSMEAQHEKILVVERVPSIEGRQGTNVQDQRRTPQISVVTQEQFEQVAQAVRELQSRLLPVGTPTFPEHAELMEELRRGASLTDAMAALQLSARLEATEKAIAQMIGMVTELAKQTPGVEIDNETQDVFEASSAPADISEAIQKGKGSSGKQSGISKSSRGKGSKGASGPGASPSTFGSSSEKSIDTSDKTATAFSQTTKSQDREATTIDKPVESTEMTTKMPPQPSIPAPNSEMTPAENEYAIKPEYVTYLELKLASKEIYNSLINTVTAITARTSTNAETAYKVSLNLERKMDSALSVSSRMNNLENLVGQYADKINALDTGLSSQMTNYQEHLTQMQHDLEIGLETMAEVLGNTGGDTVAVSELNSHFTSLQMDFDNMVYRQKELRDAQDSIAYDLENLWKEIEILRDIKSDREEVADALRDKAGIGELNGLVSLQQFDAVRGDFEKRIGAAYDKFNNQETVWQKAIDDLIRDLNEKADLIQVESLRNEINKYLNIMKDRMQILIDIVGEPKSAMLSKKLFRNTACLSCGNPAHMDKEEPNLVPALPMFHSARQPGEGAEAETKGDGDHKICYTEFPIPHPRDPRSHVCQRYCGGSHTMVTDGPARVPPGLVVQQPLRQINTELGTDGKMYLVDIKPENIPCLACNQPKPTSPTTTKHEQVIPVQNDYGNETPPPDLQMTSENPKEVETISVTPPAHELATFD